MRVNASDLSYQACEGSQAPCLGAFATGISVGSGKVLSEVKGP